LKRSSETSGVSLAASFAVGHDVAKGRLVKLGLGLQTDGSGAP
jgi:hypothetical protein